MRQSVLVAPRTSRLDENAPMPEVGADDVLVRVEACGVCASELHGWQGDRKSYPRRLGHEIVGRVEQVGRDVKSFAPGMLVTGLFGQGFAEYAKTTEDRVVPVPPDLSPEAALGEPLSCIVSAARRTPVELGDAVCIVGLGFMGLMMLQALRLKGPGRLIAVDVCEEALERALALGADEAYTPDRLPERMRLTEWGQIGRGYGVDVVVEASGAPSGLTLAGELVRAHGGLSIVGYHQNGPRQVDFELWNWKGIEICNAHERRVPYQMDCMRRGLLLVQKGMLRMDALVTHRFALENVDAAFQALETKPPGFIKSVIRND